jgi:hypothetical protein
MSQICNFFYFIFTKKVFFFFFNYLTLICIYIDACKFSNTNMSLVQPLWSIDITYNIPYKICEVFQFISPYYHLK